jgi:hypothetical protein
LGIKVRPLQLRSLLTMRDIAQPHPYDRRHHSGDQRLSNPRWIPGLRPGDCANNTTLAIEIR